MRLQNIREGFDALRDSAAQGWHRLRDSAADALTRFHPGDRAKLPAREQVDDGSWLPDTAWALLGGDVFEDDARVVVRIEAPGMAKDDFDIDVFDDNLVVHGEKRFESEATEGRWRVLQCAFGHFQPNVPLSAAVVADAARASYRDGVLRIEMPKQQRGRPRVTRVAVH